MNNDITLYPYQEDGVNFLSRRETAALFDEPGLGKTIQTLQTIKDIEALRVLVICPASVRLVWQLECKKMDLPGVIMTPTISLDYGVNICSYEGASGKLFDTIMSQEFDVLVIDEAHFLKNVRSKRTQKIYGRWCDTKGGIASRCKRIWALTGTPMPNNPSELYPMMRCLFPDAIMNRAGSPATLTQFTNWYCTQRHNGFGMEITGGKNLSRLRDQLRGRALRRKKEDVLEDLPPIRYENLYIDAKFSSLPVDEVRVIQEAIATAKTSEPFDALRKVGEHVATVRRLTGLAKVEPIKKWVKESDHDKIVLFAHHKAVIDEFRNEPDTVVVDGRSSQAQRENAVTAFQEGDARLFVGNIQAAGTGLTLTAASVLVFIESDWVPANMMQAANRIHRIGQEDSCLVYFATVPDSIDESIVDALRRKLEMYAEMGLK